MKPARNTQGRSMNPITLFILILLTSFLVFLVDQTMYYVLLGMSFLFLVLFSYSEGIKRAVVYIGLFLLIKLLAYIDLGMTTGALIGLIALFLRLYPIFNIGRILILTSPLKIMIACGKSAAISFDRTGYRLTLFGRDDGAAKRNKKRHEGAGFAFEPVTSSSLV